MGNFPLLYGTCSFHRNMDTPTNNRVESFNKEMNSAIGTRHPNLWNFVAHVKNFEEDSRMAIRDAQQGKMPPGRKRKWRAMEAMVINLKDQYMTGTLTAMQYLRSLEGVVCRV